MVQSADFLFLGGRERQRVAEVVLLGRERLW
jgi:hypothetical protein